MKFSGPILGLTLLILHPALASPDSPFKVKQQDDRQVIIDFVPPAYLPEPVTIDGQIYVLFRSQSSGPMTDEGKPDLPVEGTLIALPPNTRPVVEILASRFETVEQARIAPVPRREYVEEGEEKLVYDIDREFYSTHSQWYPYDNLGTSEVEQIRHQLVVRLNVFPIQYNPVGGSLRKVSQLQIRVRFVDVPGGDDWIIYGKEDPFFEGTYRSLISNYETAKTWRGFYRAIPQPIFPDTSGGWFVAGRQYYRIPVAQDGMYRITSTTLLQAGINPALVHYPTLAVYSRGRSIPVLIRNQSNPDSVAIEFYGRRKYGQNSFFDLYSDTSAYFLTWNDSSIRRFNARTMVSGPPVHQPGYYLEKLHLEQDRDYYFGYTTTEIKTTDDVPGEGWFWSSFFPNNTQSYTFTIDSIASGGSGSTLKVRLNGMSGFFANPDHLAEFRINGTLVGQIGFNGNLEAIFFQTIPDTVLRVGSNTLHVRSAPTAASVNKFYLDWFEIEYPRPFRATNNQILFSYSPVVGGPVEFSARGFNADTIDVFDLDGGRNIVGTIQSGSPVTSVVFRDTISVPRRYLAIARGTRMQPIGFVSKTFRNLRNRNNSADYVVITHQRFRSAADQLAAQRRNVNRLRTMVVDVQEIYDEFNFGEKAVTPLRDFLRYAYYSWRQPSPAFATIMGDASWDYRRNLFNSIKTDYVPSYGNPPSDNALVSFHPVKNYLPYMFIGRIPAEDSIQARRYVQKAIQYESPPVDEWDKSFLFITGGTTQQERNQFNTYSNRFINNYVLPPPVGGIAYRIYKTSDAIVDGEFRDSIQNLIRRGLVYMNFIGHSGGRIWNVDAGDPNSFQNTNGKLFFLNSVSCWIGFFSDPRSNVLSEDNLFADNRAAIGVWAASTTDDAVTGYFLTNKFLETMKQDYTRNYGQMTTISLLNYWAINATTTPHVIAVLHQHPLLGDSYTMMPIPLQPDLAFKDSAMSLNTPRPTADSAITLKVNWWNYGLVPTDSVLLTIADSYTDESGVFRGIRSIIPPVMVGPTLARDSVSISWNVRGQAGTHVLTARLDSLNRIPEINESNNSVQQTFYIYRNVIAALKPPSFAILPSGATALTATVPATTDTTPLTYYFEIDTVADFSSGWRRVSPPILPGAVAATWTTPALPNNQFYFWRARTSDGSRFGAWDGGTLGTSDTALAPNKIRWDQRVRRAFAQNTLTGAAATDSGLTMVRTTGTSIFVRSVGGRANPDQDFYSIIRVGNQTASGLWWVTGNRFMVARINSYSGASEYRAFDVATVGSAWADSMVRYINTTTVGFYVAIAVIFDGSSTYEPLLQAIESLGSIRIRQLQNGHAWSLIGQKGVSGPMMPVIERWSIDSTATCEFTAPNYFSGGLARVVPPSIGPVHAWDALYWFADTTRPGTRALLRVVGVRENGGSDTLATLSSAQTGFNLSGVSASQYPQIRLVAELSNSDPMYTPRLLNWRLDYSPPAELATSAWAFRASPSTLPQGTPINVTMDVHNLGYRRADSVRVSFLIDGVQVHQVVIDSVSVNGFSRVVTQVPTAGFSPGQRLLLARVSPRVGANDLFAGNNVVSFPFNLTGRISTESALRVTFDGREIIDGDFVSASPLVKLERRQMGDEPLRSSEPLRIVVDGKEIAGGNPAHSNEAAKNARTAEVESNDREEYQLQLTDGEHELRVFGNIAHPALLSGRVDSAIFSVKFNVSTAIRLSDLYNYPNPFSSGTQFAFTLTGARVADDVRVRIYTVAGRSVREIILPQSDLRVGFNTLHWDGRDEDGDEVANGYYFYRVSAKMGDNTATAIQRLVRLK